MSEHLAWADRSDPENTPFSRKCYHTGRGYDFFRVDGWISDFGLWKVPVPYVETSMKMRCALRIRCVLPGSLFFFGKTLG